MTRYEQNPPNAICDLINFVLKCAGCDLQIDVHDVEDPDNATSKLTDLQEEHNRLKITDYPLISKGKGNANFRNTMTDFFHSLISTVHAAGVLYSDEGLFESLQVWVTSMSSSAIRPFRHTATVVSLAIGNTLCSLAADIADNLAKTMRQKDSEQKKKNVNKERITVLQSKVADEERKKAAVESMLSDIFQSVYIHRYRDVDFKIRVECVTALGTWITTAPEIFFTSQHIRYLGWVLSDPSAPTRAEVIKQLSRLYKNKENVGRLRAFTERFRPRLVEMASRDAEPGIRAAAVELLDMVRDTGLLEPDDIDTIGKLIFDTEPRVRKAVAGFFAENISDLFESAMEDLGGEEGIGEYLGTEVEDDYDTPRTAWLKFICLAEVLQSYDADNDGGSEESPRNDEVTESLNVIGNDSRFTLAAQAIYEGVPEVKEWEVLAGYLLYDHSSLPADESDPERAFQARCQLNERQEILLLEILNVAVKSKLIEAVASETDKKGKRTKARQEQSREIQEKTAIHLAQVIPQLLKKFGSNPATATAVLRLEHVLNLEIFQEIRQDSTTYSSLLDDINKQFLTHADQGVLAEASTALLHARSFEDLEEITESKMQELWEDTVNTLRVFASGDSFDPNNLTNLCSTVRRIANLASISDCLTLFNAEPLSASKKSEGPKSSPHAILLALINEHLADDEPDPEAANEVDDLIISAMKALLFYNMWFARSLHAALTDNTPLPTAPSYNEFAQTVLSVMESRKGTDPVRLAAAGTYLDLYTLFATFRHTSSPTDDEDIKALVQNIPSKAQTIIISIFAAAEKQYAKKSHRLLEPTQDDSQAVDSDPEDSSLDEDDEEEDEGSGKSSRSQHEKLLAEKKLCELAGKMVLAVVGRVLDYDGNGKRAVRDRLMLNRLRLGPNYKEVVAFLDGPPKATGKAGGGLGKGNGGKKGGRNKKKVDKSEEIVRDEEDSEEEEEQVPEEGGEEDLRDRELDREDHREEGVQEDDEIRAEERDDNDADDLMGD